MAKLEVHTQVNIIFLFNKIFEKVVCSCVLLMMFIYLNVACIVQVLEIGKKATKNVYRVYTAMLCM